MTNETNRMKTKVGRIGLHGMGKRTLSLVLGLLMLLTAFGSGSVLSAIAVEGNGASVLLDAAKAGADVDAVADVAAADDKADADYDEPLAKKTDSDIADTGAAVVVKGSWDNWVAHDVGSYTASLAADSTYSFVFNDNGKQYAANTTFSASQSDYYVTENNNASFTLKTTVAGDYTFTYHEISGGSLKFDLTFPSGSTTTTWTAVGDSTAIFGTAWAPDATANDLTKSNNTWSKTWTNKYLSSGTIQYKVAKNHAWGTAYPSDNATKTVSSTGYYNVTVSYNESTNAVSMTLTSVATYSVTVPTVDNATVTVKSGTKSASEGGTLSGLLSGAYVTVTVAPDAGYKISGVTTTPSRTVSGTGNTRNFTMGSANVTLNVTIIKDTSAKKIYFNNNNAEYSMVSAYAEDSSGNALIGAKPGTTMTKLANSNIWVVEVPSAATKIMFTGDNGYNTDLLTIQSGTNPMYEAGFTKSSPTSSAPGWKTYTARTNEYTVSKGTTLNNNNSLFTGISATFYDYYTDNEVTNGWFSIANDEFTWRNDGWKWNPYTTLNGALSDYADPANTANDITYPLYFGNLNTVNGGDGLVSGYKNWTLSANNSIRLNPNSTAVQSLSGNKLANGTIRHYSSTGTNKNGNDMAMFNEDFLSGWNSKNKTLASILRSASFPVRKVDQVGKGISVTKLYLNPGSTSTGWAKDSAKFDAYFWGAGFDKWVSFPDSGTSRAVDIPAGATGVKFVRRGSHRSDWNDVWNQTGDITLTTTGSNAKNVYTFDSWDANFTPSLDTTKAGYTNNTTGHTYYEYDSTNGKDNAYITNISTTNKTASINYYNNTNKVASASTGSDNPTYGFFPFDYNNKNSHTGATDVAHDLGFGMKLEIPFTVGLNGKNEDNTPQTFDFSGDDDLWVYIDGELILDLGGAHARTTGSIDFSTKKATATSAIAVTSATNNANTYSGTTQTKSFTFDTSASGVNTPHTMTIYYMERGMFDSNLKFGFSFHAIPNQLKVEKKVRTANVNQGFYTLNTTTESDYTVDNGRKVTWFEKSYQYDNFSVDMTSGSAPKSSTVKYTMNTAPGSTQAGSIPTTATPSSSNHYLIQYMLRNDYTAYFMDQYNANTQFTLKEVANSQDLYNYDKSINVYDDANTGTEVVGTGNATDGYTFAFTETQSTGIENLNIRARFTNQMKTHDLVIRKATNNPTDATTEFKLFVKVKADSTEYTPQGFVAYPLYCTVNGESAQLAADGSISIKAGNELIIQKIPENVVVQITEDLSASTAASAYSQKNIDVHYEDGTAITTSAATSGTGVEFTMGNANVEAVVNNAVGEPVMISHNIHPDSTADAYCFVSAKVQNSAGTTTKETYNPTTGIIQIPNTYINKATTDKLVITLSTNLKNDFAQFRKFTEKITGTMADLVASKASPKYTATIDNDNRTATITINIKDLFNTAGQQIYTTLPFYSLLDKPEYKYQITYTYPAYNSDYGNYTYTAKGAFTDDELSTYMVLDGTKVKFQDDVHKATFVENKAPYVDNFMQTLTWNSAGATVGTYNTSTNTLPVSVAVNTSDPKKLTVNIKLPYVHNSKYAGKYAATVDANGVGTYKTPTNELVTGTTFEYGDWFSFTSRRSGGAEPDFIHAPDWITKNGSNVKFRYWDVYANVDGREDVIYTRCYDNGFNLALFTDCTLVPVYWGMDAPVSDAGGATIGLMETSRNQYNNGGKGSATPAAGNYRNYADDRIYVDFLVSLNKVAINGHDADTFHEEANGKFYAGVVIEAVEQLDEAGLTKTDSYYKSTYGATLSDMSGKEAALKTFIGGTANNKMMKYEFDAKTLDNKDRARVSTNFANKKTLDANNFDLTAFTNNYKYLYRAYSYVRDTSGNIVISNTPVYFTIYSVATM